MGFKKQFIILLEKAFVDFETAKLVFREIEKGNSKLDIWIVFFHLQQSVEKALKALLSYKNVHILKTHDIGILLFNLEKINVAFPFDTDELKFLSFFAVEERYGAILEKIDEPEKFLFLVEKVLKYIKEVLQ